MTKKRTRAAYFIGVLVLITGVAMAPITGAHAGQDITSAEKLLFLSNHFTRADTQQIEYRFQQRIPDEKTGNVSVDVREHHTDGSVSVTTHFLEGEQEVSIPPLEQAKGNPVILGFLERDIAQMKRLMGGSKAYFRKRIRLALAAADVAVDPVSVAYDGDQVGANKITIQPYLNDPQKDHIGKYVRKTYVFILSDSVPGKVYRLYTTEKFNQNAAAAVDTSLTIMGADPKN